MRKVRLIGSLLEKNHQKTLVAGWLQDRNDRPLIEFLTNHFGEIRSVMGLSGGIDEDRDYSTLLINSSVVVTLCIMRESREIIIEKVLSRDEYEKRIRKTRTLVRYTLALELAKKIEAGETLDY